MTVGLKSAIHVENELSFRQVKYFVKVSNLTVIIK